MKILAVSDQVVDNLYSPNVKDRFGDIDLIIGCGDLPHYYLEFLTTILNRPLYYVNGNHDTSVLYTESGPQVSGPRGCDLIDEQAVMHKGILLAGLSGSIRYNDQSEYQFTQEEMDARATRLALRLIIKRLRYGRWLDILVAHSPPLGVGDGPDRAHTGISILQHAHAPVQAALPAARPSTHLSRPAGRSAGGSDDGIECLSLPGDRVGIEAWRMTLRA